MANWLRRESMARFHISRGRIPPWGLSFPDLMVLLTPWCRSGTALEQPVYTIYICKCRKLYRTHWTYLRFAWWISPATCVTSIPEGQVALDLVSTLKSDLLSTQGNFSNSSLSLSWHMVALWIILKFRRYLNKYVLKGAYLTFFFTRTLTLEKPDIGRKWA